MFPNRIKGFVVPSLNVQHISLPVAPTACDDPLPRGWPFQVQIADIYQAARKRAVEEHELDKLFNPDFYDDFQI